MSMFLEAARSIGVKLCRDALWADSRCTWTGCSMELVGAAWIPVEKALGGDLYAGASGIAVFLADLFGKTGEPIFRETCTGAMKFVLSRLGDFPPDANLGFYSGLAGVAYCLIRVGEKLGDEPCVEKGTAIFRELAGADLTRQGLDVISGVAGAIPAFLWMRQKFRDAVFLEAALRCGEHLLSKAKPADAGSSWDTLAGTAPAGQKDLTGFSHGCAGIGWALLELHHATGDARFQTAANHAFAYERFWFNSQQENWPDFRGSPEPSYGVAWCHGAPGIGLSRLRALKLTGDAACRQEAEAALRTTRRMLEYAPASGQANYSLCHGCAGNAELFLYAAQTLGAEYRTVAERVALDGIERFHAARTPWPCGVPGGWGTPNLMLGTAGAGHFLLRLYDAAGVEPVVIVEPD